MIKNLLCIFFCLLSLCIISYSQTLVNVTGNTIIDNNHIIEYSVGEIAINTLSDQAPGTQITQGLLQPYIKIADPSCQIINDTLSYFPNPTRNILSVVSKYDWITSYQIYAMDGKLVRSAIFINNQVDMNNLPSGIYLIRILPGCDNKFRTLKVVKQ